MPMPPRDKPEGWLEIMQQPGVDDWKLANFLLMDLVHYPAGQRFAMEDTAKLLALFTAIRLHQMGKDHTPPKPK